jgi:hypothetical protein
LCGGSGIQKIENVAPGGTNRITGRDHIQWVVLPTPKPMRLAVATMTPGNSEGGASRSPQTAPTTHCDAVRVHLDMSAEGLDPEEFDMDGLTEQEMYDMEPGGGLLHTTHDGGRDGAPGPSHCDRVSNGGEDKAPTVPSLVEVMTRVANGVLTPVHAVTAGRDEPESTGGHKRIRLALDSPCPPAMSGTEREPGHEECVLPVSLRRDNDTASGGAASQTKTQQVVYGFLVQNRVSIKVADQLLRILRDPAFDATDLHTSSLQHWHQQMQAAARYQISRVDLHEVCSQSPRAPV